jgi:IS5 family transposase
VILVAAAKARGIKLRQSFVRKGKETLTKVGGYGHAKQYKRMRKATRRLHTMLGIVMRDIRRKCLKPDEKLASILSRCDRVMAQKRNDKGKMYSFHAPEVECISKGKAHKRYEFGCKVSVVSTSKNNWVLSAQALHGNPYDGHTLKGALANAEEIGGRKLSDVFVDRGYKGAHKDVPDKRVILSGTRRLSRSLKRWMHRRGAIEPIIGHMKHDNRMDRNYLKGTEGDRINAVLAAAGYNFRKLFRAAALLRRFLKLLFDSIFFSQNQKLALGMTA